MNCNELQNWLQLCLDGTTDRDAVSAKRHLAECPACRALERAASRMQSVLPRLRLEPPSPRLSTQIVSQVLADRRVRHRRRFVAYAGALAAALIVAMLGGYFTWYQPLDKTGPIAPPPFAKNDDAAHPPRQSVFSPRQSVAEAGQTVASLSMKVTEETMKQSQFLLSVSTNSLNLERFDAAPSLDPPGQSLSEAGRGVTEGLQPVANSAKRALDLLLREMPPMDTPGKP